jgi:tRNA pseudouridine32 synthase/23S rRNA pseudouridine746 synthase
MRDGVSPSRVWLPAGDWPSVLAFLVVHFDRIDPAIWQQRLREGKVLDAQGQALAYDAPYRVGQCVYYYRELPPETVIPFDLHVLYQDDHLLVIDKPHFLPVTPTGRFVQQCALTRLKQQFDAPDLTPIHRLDRETAGVMLWSRQRISRDAYQGLFRRRAVQKTYEALAGYQPALRLPCVYRSRLVKGEPFFRMMETDGEPNAETHIELLSVRGDVGHYRLKPHTGQQHQLRVHLAALGIPIVNDPFYPTLQADKADDFSQPLQLLARSIAFVDPLTGQDRVFDSQLTLTK